MAKGEPRLSEDERISKLELLTAQLQTDLDSVFELTPQAPEPTAFPYVVNNYQFGGAAVEGGAIRGGPVFVTRSGLTLIACRAYRAWRNQTGATQTRTVSVFPSRGQFSQSVDITVFVAPDGHTGAPPSGSNPTSVGRNGDSVGKTVPNGQAVFVHLAGNRGAVQRADISDGP